MNFPSSTIIKADHYINESINCLRTSRGNTVFKIITTFGSGPLWCIIYGFLFLATTGKETQITVQLILCEIIGLLSIIIIRYMTRRERPTFYGAALFPWNRYSFPSHHSLRAFLILTVVGPYYRHLIPFLLIAALLIAFSRLYLSKHYLSDVLSGALIGAAVGFYGGKSLF